jgi:hypothetical protein
MMFSKVFVFLNIGWSEAQAGLLEARGGELSKNNQRHRSSATAECADGVDFTHISGL